MKPEPQPRDVICSVCALPWPDHQHPEGVEVGLEECVRLLKIELAKRPQVQTRTIWGGAYDQGFPNLLANPRS